MNITEIVWLVCAALSVVSFHFQVDLRSAFERLLMLLFSVSLGPVALTITLLMWLTLHMVKRKK